MTKTIIAVLLIGGLGLGATLFKVGTPRSGQAYIQTMRGSHRGSTFYGGGPRHGK